MINPQVNCLLDSILIRFCYCLRIHVEDANAFINLTSFSNLFFKLKTRGPSQFFSKYYAVIFFLLFENIFFAIIYKLINYIEHI